MSDKCENALHGIVFQFQDSSNISRAWGFFVKFIIKFDESFMRGGMDEGKLAYPVFQRMK